MKKADTKSPPPNPPAPADRGLWLSCRFTQNGAVFEMEERPEDGFLSPGEGEAAAGEEAFGRFLKDPWAALYDAGFLPEKSLPRGAYAPPLRYLIALARMFAAELRSRLAEVEFLRENTPLPCLEGFLVEAQATKPFALGQEYLDETWLRGLWDHLAAAFGREIAAESISAEDYLKSKNPDEVIYGRVYFHLVENRGGGEDAPFAFLATFAAPTPDGRRVRQLPLEQAAGRHRESLPAMVKLLSQVTRAAEKSPLIEELMRSGDLFHAIRLTAQEAWSFLREIPLYESCGICCRIPDWWRRKAHQPAVSVQIGKRPPSGLGMAALLDFDVRATLDGEALTGEELEQLLREGEGLRLLKGHWVEVDHERLRRLLALMAGQSSGALTLLEALRLQRNLDRGAAEEEGLLNYSQGDWLQALQAKLMDPQLHPMPPPGEAFKAILRPYQQLGYQWLSAAAGLGLGVCLADDMGLGKTVQLIALLSSLRESRPCSTLIILPASLVGNWQNELARFAPRLQVRTLTGTPALVRRAMERAPEAEVSLTTYGQARSNPDIAKAHWDLVVLDEAQAIKNPGALQTRAIKKLDASIRIAMTGTPIENRLSDLWSLFDFLNPGLLGNKAEFSRFCQTLQEGTDRYAQLRRTISPFILRRLKTDRSIISDLPEKVEVTRYAPLEKRQAALYQQVVSEALAAMEGTEGIGRKGLVLTTLLQLKQICNHADQYLGQTAFLPEESGKMGLLGEICQTIREKRERVLVFTQFREMCEPLSAVLQGIFGRGGLVLHGGTPVKQRQQMVDTFNGEAYVPFMVLSIKAGGVGLNLTAANHVIHFDRWWNPAVENQATDRAFRIGQQRNVMVYKMVTGGTVEEKIDRMIQDKQALSREVLSFDAQSALTELSSEALKRLFQLEDGQRDPVGPPKSTGKGGKAARTGGGAG
ncbi:MAG: DEAD/DEAH box helicase [Christensenellales bacterium]